MLSKAAGIVLVLYFVYHSDLYIISLYHSQTGRPMLCYGCPNVHDHFYNVNVYIQEKSQHIQTEKIVHKNGCSRNFNFKRFDILPAESVTSTLVYCASCLETWCICTANSLVGVRTNTRVTGACWGLYSKRSSTGSINAAVLPAKKMHTLWHIIFFSTPVLMHGGLLCTAFCLSMTGPKFKLDRKSLDQNSEKSFNFLAGNSTRTIANCNYGVNPVTGRCALFNVKLHFYFVHPKL